ncbi:hypothetical protein [Parabacteroides sp. Marseille-P3160]|uniref:hypothetical protein n=1 Tax=Parabacteroides sp. Marseille-P3160 TaxID=1917887 RepID=UPI0009BB5F50|nr:hypothetical protein [Parabacteroides sp. Marseille-P3160]
MKNNYLLSCLVLLFFATSCSTYYYSRIDAVSQYQDIKNEQGDFVFENDTAQVTYRFDGENAPVRISVYNKTNAPLYVDWKRSALIVDEKATSYWAENIHMDGRLSADIINKNVSGTFGGEVVLPKNLTFVPPYSKIEQSPLNLANFTFYKIPNEEYQKMALQTSVGEIVTVRSIEYAPSTTPFYFSSYLTIYTEGDRPGQLGDPIVFDQDFYISRLIKAGSISPARYPDTWGKRGDTFYVKKSSQFGTITGMVLLGGLGVIGIVVGSSGNNIDNELAWP